MARTGLPQSLGQPVTDRPVTEVLGSARRPASCFAPPPLLSPEEKSMDIGTIYLTPHPKNENTDGEKGIAFTVVKVATVLQGAPTNPTL